MTQFQYMPPENDDDRAYVLVDELFDISLLRSEEGLIIDVYREDEFGPLGTLALDDPCEMEE